MLKASSLDLRFRTQHGLGRVLSESLACYNQFRYSSALSPAVRCASNAKRNHHPVRSQSEEEVKDGWAIPLVSSFYPTGKLRRRVKNAKFGPHKRRIVEASVRTGSSYPNTLQALQRRLLEQTGRTRLYDPHNVDTQKHNSKSLTSRKLEASLQKKTSDTCSNGQRNFAGQKKDVQQDFYISSKAVGKAQVGEGESAVRRKETAKRAVIHGHGNLRAMPRIQHLPLRSLEPRNVTTRVDEDGEMPRIRGFQYVIWTTKSADEAWDAYQALLDIERVGSQEESSKGLPQNFISPDLLSKVSRTISQAKPPTRQLFLRYLSLLARIRQGRSARPIYSWEWNALINLAGSGFRKPSLDLYNAALGIYHDLIRFSSSNLPEEKLGTIDASSNSPQCKVQPDIYTYTTLLSIALRTRHASAVRHASALINSTKPKLSRVTYLMLARFRLETEGLSGVRDGLRTLVREGHETGVDGVNIFLWAAGKEGQVEPALKVYYVLRQHVDALQSVNHSEENEALECSVIRKSQVEDNQPGPHVGVKKVSCDISNNTEGQSKQMSASSVPFAGSPSVIEGLTISKSVVPDVATYTTMIQILAYNGYLVEAMRVFADMLSTPKDLPDGEEGFQPTGPVFRALFLAYARHGNQAQPESDVKLSLGLYSPEAEWNLERLHMLLDAFISMPEGSVKPRARDIYWAMVGMEKCTGSDHQQCREVWLKLKGRFTFVMDGRMARLDAKYGQSE